MEPVVPGAAILDDTDPLSWLTSMKSDSLDAADLDDTCLTQLTSMESASLDAAVLDIVEPLIC